MIYSSNFNSYRAVNTLRLDYKNQLVNVLQRIAVCPEIHTKTHKCTLQAECRVSECYTQWYIKLPSVATRLTMFHAG